MEKLSGMHKITMLECGGAFAVEFQPSICTEFSHLHCELLDITTVSRILCLQQRLANSRGSKHLVHYI